MTQRIEPKRRFLTTSEIADYCAVSNDGVLKWIKAEKLRAFSTPGGHYRVPLTDFREFLETFGMPVDPTFFGDAEPTRVAMVVDDDADVRELVVRWLRALDPELAVEQAADGYDAGIKAGESLPGLIVLDLMMPNMDGIQLCRSLRNHDALREVAILAMTGGEPALARRALDAGADLCLMKPLDEAEFLQAAARLLRERARGDRHPAHGA